ncbi:MAG: hypothetical protein JSR30_00200 [Proteobacteria bacterium]|nr:hypothetical protein [Pseudomonadota bacterium]
MKTREWQRIERLASLDAFLLWLIEQPESKSWHRENACACPLHDFIECATGYSLNANSPELSEHWGERETQSWPTPWWMTWIIRSVDHSDDQHRSYGIRSRITRDELLSLALIMVKQDFHNPIMSKKEWRVAS